MSFLSQFLHGPWNPEHHFACSCTFSNRIPQVSHYPWAWTLILTVSFRWLLPVRSINGETERATLVACEWLVAIDAPITMSSSSSIQSTKSSPSFVHPSFRFDIFVPACLSVNTTLASMSMCNRRRFWNIVQQFEVLWRDYRTNGWEREEIFSMFGVEETLIRTNLCQTSSLCVDANCHHDST